MNDNSIDLSEIDENEILNIPLKNEDYDFKNRLKENGFDFISNNTEYTSAFPSVTLNTIGHISSASYQNKKKRTENQIRIDNMIHKIYIHYNNFLITISKEYFKQQKIKGKLYYISGKINKKKDLKSLNEIINFSLRQFLQQECNGHCSNSNSNKNLIDEIKDERFNMFLDMKYQDIYNEYYVKNRRTKLEEKFGFKTKSKMNICFLNQIKKNNKIKKEYYQKIKDLSNNFISYIKQTKWKKKLDN
jgi:hypothetical protein